MSEQLAKLGWEHVAALMTRRRDLIRHDSEDSPD
jgi:hypothetical protein